MRQVLFMTISCCLISCAIARAQNSTRVIELDTVGQVEMRKLNLAREICSPGVFNFCDGGFDVPWRSYPVFVHLDFENFIQSYEDTVYLFANPIVLDTMKIRGLPYETPWHLDSLFKKMKAVSNVVSFYVPEYKKKVNKMIKKQKLKIEFNGNLNYALYEMNFECVYGGRRKLIVPNIYGYNNGVISEKICEIYYITNIASIHPTAGASVRPGKE